MIRIIIDLYILILFIDIVLSYLPDVRRQEWAQKVTQVANFTLDPVRKYMPKDLPFDFSPIVVIILLRVIASMF